MKMVYLSLFLMNFSLAASENISFEVCVLGSLFPSPLTRKGCAVCLLLLWMVLFHVKVFCIIFLFSGTNERHCSSYPIKSLNTVNYGFYDHYIHLTMSRLLRIILILIHSLLELRFCGPYFLWHFVCFMNSFSAGMLFLLGVMIGDDYSF